MSNAKHLKSVPDHSVPDQRLERGAQYAYRRMQLIVPEGERVAWYSLTEDQKHAMRELAACVLEGWRDAGGTVT